MAEADSKPGHHLWAPELWRARPHPSDGIQLSDPLRRDVWRYWAGDCPDGRRYSRPQPDLHEGTAKPRSAARLCWFLCDHLRLSLRKLFRFRRPFDGALSSLLSPVSTVVDQPA